MKEFGVIKWYHDKVRDANYGFIENPKYDSLFFHKSSLEHGITDQNLHENTVVSFVAIPSRRKEDKWEAVEVSLINIKSDSEALVNLYLNSFLDQYLKDHFPNFLKGLYLESKKILQYFRHDESIHSFYKVFENAIKNYFLKESEISRFQITHILEIGLALFPGFDKETFGLVSSKLTPDDHVYLWEKKLTEVFPFSYYLPKNIVLSRELFSRVAKKSKTSDLIELSNLQLESLFEQDMPSGYENLKNALQNIKAVLNQHYQQILDSVSFNFTPQIEWDLWKDGVIDSCSFKTILNFFDPSDHLLTEFCLKKLTDEKLKELVPKFHQITLDAFLENDLSLQSLIGFYEVVKKSISEDVFFDLVRINPDLFNHESLIQLWLNDFIIGLPIDAIIGQLGQMEDELLNSILTKSDTSEIEKIIESLLFHEWNELPEDRIVGFLGNCVEAVTDKAIELNPEIVSKVFQSSSDFLRLRLWLVDFHDILDFDVYKQYVILLPNNLQRHFLKKVLNFIHVGRVEISVEDFTSLNVIDYGTAKIGESIDGVSLDYSISVLLNCIRDLYEQTKIQNTFQIRNRIFEIILNQIKDPKDVLQVTGFFDQCKGRTVLGKRVIEKFEDENFSMKYGLERKEDLKPLYHSVCDGRKAIDNSTKKPIVDEVSGFNFWWCANQKCFDPCRKYKDVNNWRDYAIQDFLKILKVDFIESDLEIYLGVINKVNRFLEHLKCRACDHILYPVGESKYAVHRVNNFHCVNTECEEKGKVIYLTHCLNGRCDGTIDSRDSVKCKPEGYDQETCGWYVCNDCHACCSTEKIEGRKNVSERFYQSEYKCHPIGHRDQGKICCNKCGHEMKYFKPELEKYNKVLEWFIQHKDTSRAVEKYGKNKFGKWWFKLKAVDGDIQTFYNRLLYYKRVGFNVPNLVEGNEYQLLAEPISIKKARVNELECKNCGNVVDLNEFPEKRAIMKGYHENVSLG